MAPHHKAIAAALLLCALLSPALAQTFNTATETALLEFKAKLSNTSNARNIKWGLTWVKGTACGNWTYTTCSGGNLLSLTLSGKALEGIIPNSFYGITTLTKLDLSKNRLYGPVNRLLASTNPNLVYLDLSSNFFTGRFPDVWTNPGYTADGSPPFPVSLGTVEPYVNMSNTFFSGYQTLFFSTPHFQTDPADTTTWFPYNCVNSVGTPGTTDRAQVLGDVSNTCILFTKSAFSGLWAGGEGVCDSGSIPTVLNTTCSSWCGTNVGAKLGVYPYPGPCNGRQGMACVPTFASATSDTVVSRKCVAVSTAAATTSPSLAVNIASADGQWLREEIRTDIAFAHGVTLKAIYTALGKPASLAAFNTITTTTKCNAAGLATRLKCNSLGKVTSLDLSSLALAAPKLIPSAISSLTSLTLLSLANNVFYGTFPFDLSNNLTSLVSLDVSSNFLTGSVPRGFVNTPVLVNITNNYFSGSPTVLMSLTLARMDSGQPYKVEPTVYCPAQGVSWMGANCLTLSAIQFCPGQPQRSAAECAAFCGIIAVPNAAGITKGSCNNGVGTTCVPQAPISTATSTAGKCTGTVPASPPISTQFPALRVQLLFFADQYKGWGTPASVFSTWVYGKSCTTWAGVTCDSVGNVIALDLKGKGLVGPMPGPTTFSALWTYRIDIQTTSISTIKYLDFSNNKLYGAMDPRLAYVDSIDFLDLSNNSFTGSLPATMTANFNYLGLGGNYLVGAPVTYGVDGVTPYCPGTTFPGSIASNCFDASPPAGAATCSPGAMGRAAAACKAFCPGGASSKAAPCPAKTPVCKPSGASFVCAKS